MAESSRHSSPGVDHWGDRDIVRARTGADKYAFAFLVRSARPQEQDLLRSNDGDIIGFSPRVQQVMDAQVRQIGSPPNGWVRLAMIARLGNATHEEAFVHLLDKEEQLGRMLDEGEMRLCRRGDDVEIYVNERIAKAAQRKLRTGR